MGSWTFRSNHGRMRLRDIAARAAITERSAYGIVTDLADARYVVKQKDGRRNRYQIKAHLPLPELRRAT
jgi:DNA-binding IclR family transcriptional regulator